MLLFSFVV